LKPCSYGLAFGSELLTNHGRPAATARRPLRFLARLARKSTGRLSIPRKEASGRIECAANRDSSAPGRGKEASGRASYAADRDSSAPVRVLDDTNRVSKPLERLSFAVEHDQEALERVTSVTDPPSQGTRGVSQATGRLSYATDLVSQATDRVSSATSCGSEAPNRTSSALNRRSSAPGRLLSRSNRDRRAQSRCPERNQAATSPPTCVSCAISNVPVDRARPIQDLRPDQQATSRAPEARFRDCELDERVKEAAGSLARQWSSSCCMPRAPRRRAARPRATWRRRGHRRPRTAGRPPDRAPGVGCPLLVLAAKWRISQTRSQCTLTYPEPVRATRRGAARMRSGYPTPGAGPSRSKASATPSGASRVARP